MDFFVLILVLFLFIYTKWLDQKRQEEMEEWKKKLVDTERRLDRLDQSVLRLQVAPVIPASEPPVPAQPVVPVKEDWFPSEPSTTRTAPSPVTPLHAASRSVPRSLTREPQPVSPETEKVARKSIEQNLGTNWLNRLGVTLLVFGVALFLAYQLTHIGALGKIVAGLAISGVLLAGGLWLEKKPQYRVFARAGIGGGWALFFLTIYAAHYFDATRIIGSEALDLVLLFLVGAGMVLHSLRYRSQVVTGLAFLLAFSTVTLSQVTVYSLLASAVLALGLEIVCVREEWFLLELFGIAAAYGNHLLWLGRTLDSVGGSGHPFAEFLPSTAVLLLFYLIFRIGYVLRKNTDDQAESLSGTAAVLNSAAVLFLMRFQSFHPEWAFRALLFFGALEFVFAFVVRARRKPVRFSILSVLASILVLAAIPFRFHDTTWPLLWIAESEALFLAGFFLRESILRWLGSIGLLASLVALVQSSAWIFDASQTAGSRPVTAITFILAAGVLWTNGEVLRRRLTLNENDFETSSLRIASLLASACASVALWIWFPGTLTVFAWSGFALLLLETGFLVRSGTLRVQAYCVLTIAVARLFVLNFAENKQRMAAAIVVIIVCAVFSERLRRATNLQTKEQDTLSGLAATAAATVLSTLLYLELREEWLVAAWAGLVVIQTSAALLRDGIRVRAQALLLATLVVARALVVNFETPVFRQWPLWTALALLFAAVPVAFLLRRKLLPRAPFLLRRPEQLLFFFPLALVTILLAVEIENTWLTLSWCLLGVLVFLLALAVGERSYRLGGMAVLLLGVAKLVCFDVWQLEETARYLSLIGVGIALLGVSFLYSRYAERIKEYL
jgi:uncharacterized membrane protein